MLGLSKWGWIAFAIIFVANLSHPPTLLGGWVGRFIGVWFAAFLVQHVGRWLLRSGDVDEEPIPEAAESG